MNITHIADRNTPSTEHICERLRSMVDPAADLDVICDGFLAGFEVGLTHNEHVPHPDATTDAVYDDKQHEPKRRQTSGLTAIGDDKFPTDWTLYP